MNYFYSIVVKERRIKQQFTAVLYLLSARPVLGAGVPSVSQADPSLSAWLTLPARETSGKVITLLRVGRKDERP